MLSLPDPEWHLENVVIPAGPPDEIAMSRNQRWRSMWSARAASLGAEPGMEQVDQLALGQVSSCPVARLRSPESIRPRIVG
jgi:hypothetical protein